MYAHVSMAYKTLKHGDLATYAQGNHDKLQTNGAQFTDLPVTLVAFLAAITDYVAKINAARKGSEAQTEDRDVSREALLLLMNELASYVEGVAKGDPDVIRAAGFDPVEREHVAPMALAIPQLKGATNLGGGRVQLQVVAQPNVHSVLVEYKTIGGTWTSGGGFPSTRGIIVTDLIPGTTYEIHVAFVGGAGQTGWSDPLTHIVT